MYSRHNVCVPVEEPQKLLQQPEETSKDAENGARHLVVILLALLIYILQDGANKLTRGNYERTERKCTEVIPDCAWNGACESEEWKFGLLEGPVPGGKGGGEDHFLKCFNEADAPEEAEQIDHLEPFYIIWVLDIDEMTGGVMAGAVSLDCVTVIVKFVGNAFISVKVWPVTHAGGGRVEATHFEYLFSDWCEVQTDDYTKCNDTNLKNPWEDREENGGGYSADSFTALFDEGDGNDYAFA